MRALPAFAKLAEPHMRVHAAGRHVLETLQTKGMDAAKRACADLERAKDSVLRGIDGLEAELGGAETNTSKHAA